MQCNVSLWPFVWRTGPPLVIQGKFHPREALREAQWILQQVSWEPFTTKYSSWASPKMSFKRWVEIQGTISARGAKIHGWTQVWKGENEKMVCHQHSNEVMPWADITASSDVMKSGMSRGPSTKPWGTPVQGEERNPLQATMPVLLISIPSYTTPYNLTIHKCNVTRASIFCLILMKGLHSIESIPW